MKMTTFEQLPVGCIFKLGSTHSHTMSDLFMEKLSLKHVIVYYVDTEKLPVLGVWEIAHNTRCEEFELAEQPLDYFEQHKELADRLRADAAML